MRHIKIAFGLALLVATTVTLPAKADQNCREGRTESGECINPHLARIMRHQGILMTQPKLSYTAPLSMPGDKEVVEPPRQIFETLRLQTTGRR